MRMDAIVWICGDYAVHGQAGKMVAQRDFTNLRGWGSELYVGGSHRNSLGPRFLRRGFSFLTVFAQHWLRSQVHRRMELGVHADLNSDAAAGASCSTGV